ncbi:MAG TPA: cell division protein FtsZ, partial [Flavobacteriales bacterium]|nr:cell division protein FtsZ [Flavobacteriales bacterium]
ELYGNLTIRAAFNNADEILCTAAKGIAEVITLTGEINVDMNDVNTVMRNSGRAIMGSGKASGEGRARTAVTEALESPLLNDCDITGANFVLLNITFGTEEILMDEIMEITDFIQDAAGQSAEVIWGYGVDEKLDEDLCVTVIATGFQAQDQLESPAQPRTTVFTLEEEPKEIKAPVQPTQHTQTPPVEALSEEEMPYIKKVEATEEPAPAATGQLFDLVTDEAESAETPEAEPAAADDAPPVTGTNGEPPSVTVYTLESEPLPATSDEPNLGGIRFTETPPSQPITPAQPPVEQPLSQTPDLAPNASREVIQPVTRTTEGDLQARNQRISQFTRKLKTPGGLADLEAEPAYKRRQVILDDIDHSSKSQVSRFTLHEETDEEGERTIELRNDNPFLHDNVD